MNTPTQNGPNSKILKEITELVSGLYDPHNYMLRSTAFTFHVNSRDHLSKKQYQGSPDGKKEHRCLFCKGPHAAHNCDVITDHQKHLKIVKGVIFVLTV